MLANEINEIDNEQQSPLSLDVDVFANVPLSGELTVGFIDGALKEILNYELYLTNV